MPNLILKSIRVLNGLHQAQVARCARITQQQYSRIETGHTDPDPKTAKRIANILNTDVDLLFPSCESRRP